MTHAESIHPFAVGTTVLKHPTLSEKRKDVADELVKVLSEGADGIFYNDENERWRID